MISNCVKVHFLFYNTKHFVYIQSNIFSRITNYTYNSVVYFSTKRTLIEDFLSRITQKDLFSFYIFDMIINDFILPSSYSLESSLIRSLCLPFFNLKPLILSFSVFQFVMMCSRVLRLWLRYKICKIFALQNWKINSK